jgi:histone acetyltransferase (RNA polymerase elongator complex component)
MQIFPVFIPQKGCPFQCIYCDQSSLGSTEQIPFAILPEQIRAFCRKHCETTKQIAFYGGSFTGMPEAERNQYFDLVSPYLDEKTTIRISTRPDMVNDAELQWCLSHGIKTIELGIQSFDDAVLLASKRGYDSRTAVESCLRVKTYGFELGIQLMPGLPGYTPTSPLVASGRPRGVLGDFLRVYPPVILRGTELWDMWEAGTYTPLSLEEAITICADFMDWADENKVKIIKVGIPSLAKDVEYAGPYHPAFGELVKGERLVRRIAQSFEPEKSIHLTAADISLLTGHKGFSLHKLVERTGQKSLPLVPDASLHNGEIRFSADT